MAARSRPKLLSCCSGSQAASTSLTDLPATQPTGCGPEVTHPVGCVAGRSVKEVEAACDPEQHESSFGRERAAIGDRSARNPSHHHRYCFGAEDFHKWHDGGRSRECISQYVPGFRPAFLCALLFKIPIDRA